jgi:hypothetical protein
MWAVAPKEKNKELGRADYISGIITSKYYGGRLATLSHGKN